MFIEIVGYISAVLTAGIAVPQAVRSLRVGTAGVSPLTFQLFWALAFMWSVYAVSQQLWAIVPGNVFQVTACTIILVQCFRHGAKFLDVMGIGAVLVGASALLAQLWSPVAMIWLAIAVGVIVRVPQITRARTSASIDGISLATWWMAALCNLGWLIYAIGHNDPRIMASSILNGSASAVIIAVVMHRKRTTAPPTQPVDAFS